MSVTRGPEPDVESAAFWAGVTDRRIILQECASCGRRRLPRMPACPYCGASGCADVEVSGTGTIYSWVRVQRDLGSGTGEDVPYTVVTVDLDGGGRVFGRLDPPEAAVIGALVEPRFVTHGDWTELAFGPVPAGGTAR